MIHILDVHQETGWVSTCYATADELSGWMTWYSHEIYRPKVIAIRALNAKGKCISSYSEVIKPGVSYSPAYAAKIIDKLEEDRKTNPVNTLKKFLLKLI